MPPHRAMRAAVACACVLLLHGIAAHALLSARGVPPAGTRQERIVWMQAVPGLAPARMQVADPAPETANALPVARPVAPSAPSAPPTASAPAALVPVPVPMLAPSEAPVLAFVPAPSPYTAPASSPTACMAAKQGSGETAEAATPACPTFAEPQQPQGWNQ